VATYDVVVRGGRYFDGLGGPSAIRDLGIRAGRVTTISSESLPTEGADVVDAQGKWVTPGLVDIHTHYDVEVLAAPALSESVRHGVTTVLMGNCSLSTVFADADDCADMFSRVEALPWEAVHSVVKHNRTWRDACTYVERLRSLPLGANVAALIGHSDMRVAAMGIEKATDAQSKPTRSELDAMRTMLTDALDAGFAGLSTIRSSFSKLDGVRYPARQLPSTYATWHEFRQLHRILRDRGGLVQCTPNVAKRSEILRFFEQSTGRFGRAPLKTSFLTAADLKSQPGLIHLMIAAAKAVNKIGNADFRWQHLPVPFEAFADGMDLVVFEEFGSGTAALNVREVMARSDLLATQDYRRWFRRDLERRHGATVWHRDLHEATIVSCPDPTVVGRSFGAVGQERGIHPADAFLDLVVAHGADLRWRTTIANDRPKVLDRIATDPTIHMGFADSGAHLRNMAFYNAGLRFLDRVRRAEQAGAPIMTVERAVHRLTGELGRWYGLDAGTLGVGGRADVAVIDPRGLGESADSYAEASMPELGGIARMVNRNDGAVAATVVGGQVVHRHGTFTDGLGTTLHAGQFLAAGRARRSTEHAAAR